MLPGTVVPLVAASKAALTAEGFLWTWFALALIFLTFKYSWLVPLKAAPCMRHVAFCHVNSLFLALAAGGVF